MNQPALARAVDPVLQGGERDWIGLVHARGLPCGQRVFDFGACHGRDF
jgi:hypothetical protein